MRVAVIDSGPLINLVHLGLARELTLYFNVVYVPRAVQREVNKKQRFRYRLQKLFNSGIFERCASSHRWNVELLRIDLDDGEAEALIQAQEKSAAVFIGDETRARAICTNFGLQPVGAVRLLARLHREGRAGEPAVLSRKLRRDLRFRVTAKVIEAAIALANEPI